MQNVTDKSATGAACDGVTDKIPEEPAIFLTEGELLETPP
jgi:hypothetical protein